MRTIGETRKLEAEKNRTQHMNTYVTDTEHKDRTDERHINIYYIYVCMYWEEF